MPTWSTPALESPDRKAEDENDAIVCVCTCVLCVCVWGAAVVEQKF